MSYFSKIDKKVSNCIKENCYVKANKRKYDFNFYETRQESVNNEVNNNGNLEGVKDGINYWNKFHLF